MGCNEPAASASGALSLCITLEISGAARASSVICLIANRERIMADTNDQGETFSEWLLKQGHQDGALGDLACACKADPKFPRRGSPEDVRGRLNDMQADGDMHAAVDDAETDWRAY